jgi:hypothetical protein
MSSFTYAKFLSLKVVRLRLFQCEKGVAGNVILVFQTRSNISLIEIDGLG